MAFEDLDMDMEDVADEEVPEPEESGRRTFVIVVSILAGITLIALVCIAVYALVIVPQRGGKSVEQAATINAQNTEVAFAITQTYLVSAYTATPTDTPVPDTATPTSTSTPVVAEATETGVPTQDPRTATVSALLTANATGDETAVPTSTALPSTGFVDDVGVPGLLVLAVMFIVVIFLTRRFRMAS